MTPPRAAMEQQIRQILREVIPFSLASQHSYYRCNAEEVIAEKLLACWPKPSRDSLFGILNSHFAKSHDHEVPCPSLMDDLMAWAEGREQSPTWCTHLQWKNMDDDEHGRPSGWYATNKKWCFYYADDFKFCPLCAQPRPGA